MTSLSSGDIPRRPRRLPLPVGYRVGQLTVIGEKVSLPYGKQKRTFYPCRVNPTAAGKLRGK